MTTDAVIEELTVDRKRYLFVDTPGILDGEDFTDNVNKIGALLKSEGLQVAQVFYLVPVNEPFLAEEFNAQANVIQMFGLAEALECFTVVLTKVDDGAVKETFERDFANNAIVKEVQKAFPCCPIITCGIDNVSAVKKLLVVGAEAPTFVLKPAQNQMLVNSDIVESLALDNRPSEKFEPLFVKVHNGVTHIIARFGKVLLYIECSASGFGSDAKAWVLGVAGSAEARLAGYVQPVNAQLKRMFGPIITNIDATVATAKAKGMAVVVPIQVKVYDGYVYVQGVVANTYVAISAKATSSWATATVYSSSAYDHTFGAVLVRAQAATQWTYAIASQARMKGYDTVEPLLMRASNGCLYVQTSVGSTVIRIKVGVLAQQRRISALAHRVQSQIGDTIGSFTAPVVQRIVALYENVLRKLVSIAGPYLERLEGLRSTLTTQVEGIVVSMKVRAASARERAMFYPSMYYVKVKDGCVYLYSIVGDKVVGIKVSVNELLARMNETVMRLSEPARSKLMAVTDSITTNAIAVSDNVKGAVSDQGLQATAAGSIGGSAALGAAGTVVGAACGIIPAIFTFGLSIPIGAAIGGTVGSTVGFIGGGVAGRTAHKHRAEIGDGVAAVANKATDFKVRSKQGLDQITEKVSSYNPLAAGKTVSIESRPGGA